MSVLAQLEQWKRAGAISGAQFDALEALVRRDRFPVFLELNALFYLGVLSIVAGVGWTIATYAANLGDVSILLSLTAAVGWSLFYCLSRAQPYGHGRIEAPTLAFDYVLYLGCLLFAAELGYVESRFHLFGTDWDHSLLAASLVFFALSYRFDNRLVLSLALSSLGAWFGVRLQRVGLLPGGTLREAALGYGAIVVAAGLAFYHAGIKRHFLEAYLHVAINVVGLAVLSGVASGDAVSLLYLVVLLGMSGAALAGGLRYKRFIFVVYGVLYAYAGITIRLLRNVRSVTPVLIYFIVSGSVVVIVLVVLARRFGRET